MRFGAARFLLRVAMIYCFQKLIPCSSLSVHAAPFVYRRYHVSVNHARAMLPSGEHNELQRQLGKARALLVFYLRSVSIRGSWHQRNCCQQVTHSIKHPIRGYKQNTSYFLIAQREKTWRVWIFRTATCFQTGEGARKQKFSPRLMCFLFFCFLLNVRINERKPYLKCVKTTQ